MLIPGYLLCINAPLVSRNSMLYAGCWMAPPMLKMPSNAENADSRQCPLYAPFCSSNAIALGNLQKRKIQKNPQIKTKRPKENQTQDDSEKKKEKKSVQTPPCDASLRADVVELMEKENKIKREKSFAVGSIFAALPTLPQSSNHLLPFFIRYIVLVLFCCSVVPLFPRSTALCSYSSPLILSSCFLLWNSRKSAREATSSS